MAGVGSWMPAGSGKKQVWVRSCYSDLYTDVRELASLGKSFIHISGNSGIGKSCFLWYVRARLLEDRVPTVIVQLVRGDPPSLKETLVFKPDGSCSKLVSPEELNAQGVWLLTDQAYVGDRAENGTTILFASPKESNWKPAEKVMDEGEFTSLYMPPWSVDELQKVYFHTTGNNRRHLHFWTIYYVAGPIVSYYLMSFQKAYNEIKTGMVLNGGWDQGKASHKLFVFWPTLDFTSVHHISFASEWVVDCFAIACINGSIKDCATSILNLAADRTLRGAAGILFERYCHFRLSRGGEFCSIDDPTKKLLLERREVKFFSGNSLAFQIPSPCYFRHSSTSFPVIDSVYPPLVLFQISHAAKRKSIKKSDYEALCSSLRAFRQQHPVVPSGLQGVPDADQVHLVLVKMEGDNTRHSKRLCLVEDVPVVATQPEQREMKPEPEAQQRLKRKRVQRSISKVKREAEEAAAGFTKKKTYVPFQMTIALPMDHAVSSGNLSYSTIAEIYNTVSLRMNNNIDTGARRFGDLTTADADLATVLLRRGTGSIHYQEAKDGVPVFGAWIEAVRTMPTDSDLAEETLVSIQCTTGKLAGHELTIFLNERLLPDNEFGPPVALDMLHESWSRLFDPPPEVDPDDTFRDVYDFQWSGTSATVVITSQQRASRKLKLVFPADEVEEAEEEDEEEVDEDFEDRVIF